MAEPCHYRIPHRRCDVAGISFALGAGFAVLAVLSWRIMNELIQIRALLEKGLERNEGPR